MNDDATDLNQTDEETLTYEVSDEEMEAAAETNQPTTTFWTSSCYVACCNR